MAIFAAKKYLPSASNDFTRLEKGRGRPVAEAPPLSDGCKPDSVQPATHAAGLDGHLSRRRGSRAGGGSLRNGDQYPEGSPLARRSGRRPDPSCSVLHRMGFFVPPCLRSGRWAFTPPFHPCRPACAGVGGMFSVTLSVGRGFRAGLPRVLRGMLPCGVRTFLSACASQHKPSDRPPSAKN